MNDFLNKAFDFFQKIPAAPTNPQQAKSIERFDIKDLYESDATTQNEDAQKGLDEKLRQAYFWITNTAIISPFYDIEYDEGDNTNFVFGDSQVRVSLPTGQSYSSFVLIPL